MSPPGAGDPGILALGDEDRLRGLLTAAGFVDVTIERVGFVYRFVDAADYWAFLTEVAGAIAMVIARLDHDEQREARARITARVARFERGGGLDLPAECLVATAAVPSPGR